MASLIAHDTQVIDSPILYWISNGRENLDQPTMRANISQHYSDDEIAESRTVLAEIVKHHHLTHAETSKHVPWPDEKVFEKRKTTSPSVMLSDIFCMLDHNCTKDLSLKIVNSVHRKLPPLSPVDNSIDLLFLIENTKRMLNDQKRIDDTLGKMRSDIEQLQSGERANRSKLIRGNSLPLNGNQPDRENHIPVQTQQPNSSYAARASSALARPQNQVNMSTAATAYNPAVLNESSTSALHEAEFQIAHNGRKPRRVPGPVMFGTAVGSGLMRAAKSVQKIFVSKIDPDTNADKIQTYLKARPEMAHRKTTVTMLKSRFPDSYSSAVVTFSDCTLEEALDSSIWPQGVFIKEWQGRIPNASPRPRANFERNGSND